MALTGLTGIQISNLNVSGIATFEQTVGIAGTLTYEDVTNVDSVGLVTARDGIKVSGGQVLVGSATSLHSTGLDLGTGNITGHNLKSTGIITATSFVGSGANLTGIDATAIKFGGAVKAQANAAGVVVTGILTATSFVGSGANLTSLPSQVTINNASANRVLTSDGGTTLNGEQYLTYTSQSSLNLTDGNGTSLLGGNYLLLKRSTGNANYINAPLANADLILSADENLLFHTVHTADYNSTERARITSSGQMGLGMTPTRMFEVKDSTGANRIANIRGTGASGAYLAFLDQNTTDDSKCRVGSSGGNNLVMRGDTVQFATGAGSEHGRFDGSGRLLIGHTAAHSVGGGNSLLQIQATNSTGRLSVVQHRNEAGGSPFISLGKSRGGSNGSTTILQSGDEIGTLTWAGADGNDLDNQACCITGVVDGTPANDNMPGRLEFRTTPAGSSSATTRVVIKEHGRTQVNLPSTSGSSSAISTAQAIVGTKHIHTVYHNFNSTNSGLAINSVIPTNSAGTVDIMGGWANGNGIIFKRFVWCASGATAISQVFSTAASRYGVSVSISTPTMSISGDYVNFNFTFSDSQGSKMEKLKIHFEYHKQFYVI